MSLMSIFHTNNRRRLNSLTFGLILVLSTITTVLSPFVVSASSLSRGVSSDETELITEIKNYQEVAALRNCMEIKRKGDGGPSPQDAYNGNWFDSGDNGFVGTMSDSGVDVSSCNDLVASVSAQFGYNNSLDFLCSFVGYDRNNIPCKDSNVGEFYPLDWEVRDSKGVTQEGYTFSDAFFANYEKRVTLSEEAKYLMYLKALTNTGVCNATEGTSVIGKNPTIKVPRSTTSYYTVTDGDLGSKVTSNTILEYINTQINATGATPAGYTAKVDSVSMKDVQVNVNMPDTWKFKTIVSASGYETSPIDISGMIGGTYNTRTFAPIWPVFNPNYARILAIDNPLTATWMEAGLNSEPASEKTITKDYFPLRLLSGKDKVDVGSDDTTKGIYGGSDLITYDRSAKQGMSIYFMDCSGIVEAINDRATDFGKWAAKRYDSFINTDTGKTLADAVDSGSSCAVQGIGWIICPTMTFLGGITDASYSLISKEFLSVDSDLVSTNGPAYQVWQSFRSIANILFVIVFLIIIFSQLTGAGITNYGVKKTLPRLVIAAILVNASFFISQFAVDISNILGFSIKQLFEAVPVYSEAGTSGLEAIGQGLAWVGIVATVIAGAALAAMAITIPVLLAALLAVLMTVLILMGRQAIIVLLIVISPIAFVAWMLPNTQQWFKKWWKMFYTLLLVFPVVGLLFGAGQLAAKVIQGSSTDIMIQVFALGVASMPLIMTPSLLKGAMSATGAVGAKLSGLSDKANRRVGGKVKETSRAGQLMDYRKQSGKLKRAKINSGAYKGSKWNVLGNASSRLNSAFNDSSVSGKFGDRGAAAGTALINKEEAEEVSNAVAQMKQLHGLDIIGAPKDKGGAQKELAAALKSGDTIKARAAASILLSSGAMGAEKLHSIVAEHDAGEGNSRTSETYKSIQQDVNAAGIKGTDAALATWSYTTGGGIKDIENNSKTYAGLKMSEVATQTEGSLRRAAAVEGISKEMAARVLEADTSKTALTNDTTAILDSIASGKPIAASQPTVNQTAPQASVQPTATNGTGRPTIDDPEVSEAAKQGESFHIDDNGRQTPDSASDNYHDGMSR